MLLFSTLLSIQPYMTPDDFISLVIEWNQTSSHTSNIVPSLYWHGEHTIRFGNDRVWLSFIEHKTDAEHTVAARYWKTDDNGAIWTTDYVMNFTTYKMSIRLDRTYVEEAIAIDGAFSTPHFITLLINKGYLADDGGVPVTRTPVLLTGETASGLADTVQGTFTGKLPFVYVSKMADGQFAVDVQLLASRLKGVAHVYVEDALSLADVMHTDGEELVVFDELTPGSIRVFFPRSTQYSTFAYYDWLGGSNLLMEKVTRAVIQYSNIQEIGTQYTWAGVEQAILVSDLEAKRRALQEVKPSSSDELEAFIESFDEEITKLQDRVMALTEENGQLAYENKQLKTKINETDGNPLLTMGNEADLYVGEIRDMIVTELKNSAVANGDACRRFDIIHDIVCANSYEAVIEQRFTMLKSVLKTYDRMTPKVRKVLNDLGFAVTEDGKHYKLTYYNDDRYVVTIAKTPSDVRAGKNIVAEIRKKVY